jgi:hypothetical protein
MGIYTLEALMVYHLVNFFSYEGQSYVIAARLIDTLNKAVVRYGKKLLICIKKVQKFYVKMPQNNWTFPVGVLLFAFWLERGFFHID